MVPATSAACTKPCSGWEPWSGSCDRGTNSPAPRGWCCREWAPSTIASTRSDDRNFWRPRANSSMADAPSSESAWGYQALFERSEEFQSCAQGMGIFGGPVVRFTPKPDLKIPQDWLEPAADRAAGLPVVPGHTRREPRLLRSQLLSTARGPVLRGFVDGLRRGIRVIGLEGQPLRHPVPPGEEPGGGLGAPAQFRGTGGMTRWDPDQGTGLFPHHPGSNGWGTGTTEHTEHAHGKTR